VFQHHPRLLHEVMQASAPEVLMEHDICFRPAAKFADAAPLGSGPVSLVGDAAHAKRPNGACGCACSLVSMHLRLWACACFLVALHLRCTSSAQMP
jgi:2-polyprenyl-6-methoxyphenol hydroxylase-like FAD-dependent oxidoreductase